MKALLDPIKTDSLKEVFISRFEELILSGKLAIGQKLPSERELAFQLGVSRPIVHEGLVDLAFKGLVSMQPRVGTVVNDYRKEGSLALLNSLINYHQGEIDPSLLSSMLDMRRLFEVETARLAALNRSDEQLQELKDLLVAETSIDKRDIEGVADLDFGFHHTIAMASGNMIYPLVLNSFRHVYTNLSGRFFSDAKVVQTVFDFHGEMVQAIRDRDSHSAMDVMERILQHGASHLLRILLSEKKR